MTVAIGIKVTDGLVLASDSATTLMGPAAPGGASTIVNIYNNANKVFNLYKGLPIGGMTWSGGSIGNASISTLAKDFRALLTHPDTEWSVDRQNYTIEEIAKKARKFLYEEQYLPYYQGGQHKPVTGFLVAGCSSNQGLAEAWLVDLRENAPEPIRVLDLHEFHPLCYGQPEALHRLLFGTCPRLLGILTGALGVPPDQIDGIMQVIRMNLQIQMIQPAMPIQDAIELADFLVHLTSMYSRFSPGAPTVGGPTEIAAITKHEGFKWIKRKHYYDPRYNPPTPEPVV